MSAQQKEILEVFKRQGRCWLILSCGHWYKWTGATAPKKGGECPCPSCITITVTTGPVTPA